MSWTKRQLCEEAFAELALAGYSFDLQPEEMQRALRRLDSMMATWDAKGIRVGYRLPASPDASDPDEDSGLPDTAAETVYLHLALRLAPGEGKQISQDTRRAARDGYEALLFEAARPRQQQFPHTMPLGAGNKPGLTGRTFMPAPDTNPLQVADGGSLDLQE